MFKLFRDVVVLPFVALIMLSQIVGCSGSSVESEDILTSGMWAKMKVDGQQDGLSRVVVELNVGGEFGTNVVLSDGEYLEVSAAGESKRMEKDYDFFDIDYQTYMDTNASDIEFVVGFYRNSGENIVNSKAVMPAAFDITQPSSNSSFHIDDVIDIVWTPSRADKSIRLYESFWCTNMVGQSVIMSENQYIDDTGHYEFDISLSNIFQNGSFGLDQSKPCTLSLKLVREEYGSIDPAFDKGGSFKATQTREVSEIKINLI